ncbi:MAG: hypothetical protein DRG59_03655 [Deltaproteobacteria bacterium]|nr:MAG: hypothetical protein DRG59_03655 [Deltaproteobacteria bacterium]
MQEEKQKPSFDILMGVGARYYPTPSHFINEAKRLGVSKRIPGYPRFFKTLYNKVWLVHWKTREIFGFFIPQSVEIIGDAEEIAKVAEKVGAKVEKVDPKKAAAEPERGCGKRQVGGGYLVAYCSEEQKEQILEEARKSGIEIQELSLAGPLVVIPKEKRIKYKGPFFRGYRYIKVNLKEKKYKIIKIKVKKKKVKK